MGSLIRDTMIYPEVAKTLTANGGSNGVLTVASTNGLHVGQPLTLSDNTTTPKLFLQVLEVLSTTQFSVGPWPITNQSGYVTQNCSAYTTANAAAIKTIMVTRDFPEKVNVALGAYETAPVAAFRVMNVDPQGNFSNNITIVPTPVTSLVSIDPQFASLAFGAVTGTSAGTANTILTLNADRSILQVINNLDANVGITYKGVQKWELPSYSSFVLDFATNGLKMDSAAVIGVFYLVGAPTGGTINATAT